MSPRLLMLVAAIAISSVFLLCSGSTDTDADDTRFTVDGFTYHLRGEFVMVSEYDPSESPDAVIPGHVTYEGKDYYVAGVEVGAFYDQRVTSVTLPETVYLLEEGALNCPSIKFYAVDPQNVIYTAIDGVLYDAELKRLVAYPSADERTTYEMPLTVVTIDPHSFESARSLISITLPESLEDLPLNMFTDCTSLRYINNHDGVNHLPESLCIIEQNAFQNCESLETVILPDSLIYIGNMAFSNTALSTVHIPESVTYIGSGAFMQCKYLTSFESSAEAFPTMDGVLCEKTGEMMSLKAYPSGALSTTYRVPSDVGTISYMAFAGAVYLEHVLIEEMTVVPPFAFCMCPSLKLVTLSDYVFLLDEYCFAGCTNLTEIEFGAGLYLIGDCAFSNTALETITIPSTVTNLGAGAFEACPNLKEVIVEGSLASVGETAFGRCTSLNDVWFEGASTSFSEGALNVGLTQQAKLTVHVSKGCIVPDDACTDPYTTLVVVVIGERPYPYENIFAALVCVIIVILIFRIFKDV